MWNVSQFRGPTNELTGLEYQPACPPSGITTMIGFPAVRSRMPRKSNWRKSVVAAVEHVEDGIGASAGAVIVRKQDVDAGIPADRGGLEPVVPQARVVLVAVHDRQAEPVAAPDEYDQYLPDVDDVGIGDAVDGGDQRIKRGVTIETHSQRRQRVPGDNRVSRDVRDDQPLPHIDRRRDSAIPLARAISQSSSASP